MNSNPETASAPCPIRALVADDDAEMLDLVASALRQDGLVVTEATDGKELVRLVDEGPPPDIVITDVHMPGMSGLEALAHIHKCHPEIPVVLMSAFATPRLRDQANVNGPAAAVLSKPFELASLRDVVTRQTIIEGRGPTSPPRSGSAPGACAHTGQPQPKRAPSTHL